MKKILFFAAVMGLLTACDPIKDDGSFSIDDYSAEQLKAGFQFQQFSDAECTMPADNGNYIKFSLPQVSAATIYAMNADGTEQVLSFGKSSGVFNFTPKRGSDPNQTIYIRYINPEGKEVVVTQELVLAVASDLKPEIKLLVSNDGVKTWKWNYSAPEGRVWGNLGSDGNYDGFGLMNEGAGQWWGVTSEEEFKGQLNHTEDGVYHNDGSPDARMVFDEDGKITCYDAEGEVIRKGTFSVLDYDPTASGKKGILQTSEGAILWPYQINAHDNDPAHIMPTDFEIAYLSPSKLVLVYPDAGVWVDWKEATFWQFCSETDVMGCLADNSEATWTWDDDNSLCWGNAGYGGFVYGGASSISGNTWWGVPSTDLADQIANYGYSLNDGNGATMTFDKDGLIKKSSGGSGSFTYDVNNTTDIGGYAEGKTKGRFMTSGDGILFPIKINSQDKDGDGNAVNGTGQTTSEFDIVYMDEEHFVLCYPNFPKGGDNASWMEGTIWRFKKVK